MIALWRVLYEGAGNGIRADDKYAIEFPLIQRFDSFGNLIGLNGERAINAHTLNMALRSLIDLFNEEIAKLTDIDKMDPRAMEYIGTLLVQKAAEKGFTK